MKIRTLPLQPPPVADALESLLMSAVAAACLVGATAALLWSL